MKIRILMAVMLLLFTAVMQAATYRSRNFTVNAHNEEFARQCAVVCERSRIRIAEEWVGRNLPNWPRSCPVQVTTTRGGSGGGATTFAFLRGHAFGFRIVVRGPRARILNSVLPHEVSHAVFATAIGRPLPKWCDEGACMLAEVPSANRVYVRRARRLVMSGRHMPVRVMFAMTQYPRNGNRLLDLYAQGHMVTSHLVAKRGKRYFFEFMKEGANERSLRRRYGLSILQLQSEWTTAVQRGDRPTLLARNWTPPQQRPQMATIVPVQLGEAEVTTSKPKLYVYGTTWCDPCKVAKAHWKSGQWRAIEEKFDVVPRDVDIREQEVSRLGIENIPSFVIGNRVIAQGYRGPEWLTEKLLAHERDDTQLADHCPPPRQRRTPTARREPSIPPSMQRLQEMAIRFIRANPEMFRGPRGPQGEQGDPGGGVSDEQISKLREEIQKWMSEHADVFKGKDGKPIAITVEQIAAAITAWFAENPLDSTVKDAVTSWIELNIEQLKGKDTTSKQITLALTQYFKDNPLPNFNQFLTKKEFHEALADLKIEQPITPPTKSRVHIVVVADKDADYWQRLDSQIKEARNHASTIRIAPPPTKFAAQHPQIVFYKDGNWEKRFVGTRAVSEILNQIAREEYTW